MFRHEYLYNEPFQFEDGEQLDRIKLVYHTSSKEPRWDGRKVIWVCHALTANSDAEDWWNGLVGVGKLFDTEKYFVVCVNMLGSAYGSSGPASLKADGTPYYFDFPRVTVRDIVSSLILVRKHLGIDKIDIALGGSIGGFQSLEWAIMEPDVVRCAVIIGSGARVTPWLTAHDEAQRMALEADQTFRACENLHGGEMGLRCARANALISYRSYEGYNLTQAEESQDTLFADRAGSYERYQGKKLSDRFDAYSYYYMTLSVDSHNVGRGRGGVENALRGIKAHCALIGIDSDCLFPVCESKFMAEHIPNAEYHEITSKFGHDGFLLESGQIAAVVAPMLEI